MVLWKRKYYTIVIGHFKEKILFPNIQQLFYIFKQIKTEHGQLVQVYHFNCFFFPSKEVGPFQRVW